MIRTYSLDTAVKPSFLSVSTQEQINLRFFIGINLDLKKQDKELRMDFFFFFILAEVRSGIEYAGSRSTAARYRSEKQTVIKY